MKSHTDSRYEADLAWVHDALERMGAVVEEMIRGGVEALVAHDGAAARRVIERDPAVDGLEMEIDDRCIRVLALRQPTASDLRFLATTLKAVVDLERIGDLAVNIAERVIELTVHPPLKPYIDLPRMGRVAGEMLDEAVQALVTRDAARARAVFPRDNAVDALYAQVLRELLTFMIEDPRNIFRANRLLSIAKYLERIGDHATNLAEQAIFLVEGRDVRHQGLGRPDLDEELRVPPERGVLFVDGDGSRMARLAMAWARHLAPHGVEVEAASVEPGAADPRVARVLADVGLDLAGGPLSPVSVAQDGRFDVMVLLDDRAAGAVLPPAVVRLRWCVQDPGPSSGDEGLAGLRVARDELAARVERLFRRRGEP
jgi:phosphate transport system protein